MSTTSLSNACATALSIFVGAKGSCGSQSATPVLNACAQDDSLLWSSNFASAMMDQVSACQSNAAYTPPLLEQSSLIALIVAGVIVALNLVSSIKKVLSSNAEEAQYRLKGYNPADDVERTSRVSDESSSEVSARDVEAGEAAGFIGKVIAESVKTGAHIDNIASNMDAKMRNELAETANEEAKIRKEAATCALKAAQQAQKLAQREAMEAQKIVKKAQKSAAAAAKMASKSSDT
ncbi:hypothetical protein BC830DRAFT_1164352 [Chytriomyces sp. MP71]|nr:hypothetical protein BC830DRAFT_1227586 [Chytriomyces sp. MP71]KAI8620729.1 hypothetical protein BC830DRAFT_1164352 [Chytriomyces sp. MP71]